MSQKSSVFFAIFKENISNRERKRYGNRGKSEGRQGFASHCRRLQEGIALPEDRISSHFKRRWLREVVGRKTHVLQARTEVQELFSYASEVFPA